MKNPVPRIIFAKVLESPPRKYQRIVQRVLFSGVRIREKPPEWIVAERTGKVPKHPKVLGMLLEDQLVTPYPEQFYRFRPGAHAIRRLLDVSRRNYLQRLLCEEILRSQQRFIASGRSCDLVPLPLSNVFARGHPYRFHISHFNRLLNSIAFDVHQTIFPAAVFFPSRSYVARERIKYIVAREAFTCTVNSDRWLREHLARSGLSLSLRTVTECRTRLGIPSARIRRRCLGLPVPPSPLVPLCRESISKFPKEAAVYFFREGPEPDAPILYIGRTGNLRKRMQEYIRGTANEILRATLKSGNVRIGYLLLPIREISRMEWHYYHEHIRVFGHPPRGNRIKPPCPFRRNAK